MNVARPKKRGNVGTRILNVYLCLCIGVFVVVYLYMCLIDLKSVAMLVQE